MRTRTSLATNTDIGIGVRVGVGVSVEFDTRHQHFLVSIFSDTDTDTTIFGVGKSDSDTDTKVLRCRRYFFNYSLKLCFRLTSISSIRTRIIGKQSAPFERALDYGLETTWTFCIYIHCICT